MPSSCFSEGETPSFFSPLHSQAWFKKTFNGDEGIFYFLCRILNKLTPEKFDLLKGQLIDSGITSADILKVTLSNSASTLFICLRLSIIVVKFYVSFKLKALLICCTGGYFINI